MAVFAISHEGFCKGLVMARGDSGTLLVCASGQAGLIVTRIVEVYIRPIVTLDPARARRRIVDSDGVEEVEEMGAKHGTVMAVCDGGGSRVLAVYEVGVVVVWDWAEGVQLGRLDVLPQVGTPMAMDFDW